MATCKIQADCSPNEVCSDGQCVPVEVSEPRKVRRTFATAAGEVTGKIKAEQKQLTEFQEFLTEQLEEASEERQEEAESSDFWGQILGIGGGIAGFLLGPANPVLWATVGATLGSGVGRFGADIVDDAEDYGLTEDELNRLSEDDLLYMRGTYQDIVKSATEAQENLDDFDKNQWKTHVMGMIGDTWSAYQMASFGKGLGMNKLFQEKDIAATDPGIRVPYDYQDPSTLPAWEESGYAQQINIPTILDVGRV